MERILFVLIATVMVSGWATAKNADSVASAPSHFNEATVADLQAKMAAGTVTSEQLTKYYLHRILALDQNGPGVNSVIELNPEAIGIAEQMDDLRMRGKVLGPLHGIPVLIKDNIDTGDRMQTSAGSLALAGRPALTDSTVAAKLRAGGAVILGKTNLSEWANFRSFESISGWSGRGGQTNNPYRINRKPCGSSSGSGAAASADFAVFALGSETDGSIVWPSHLHRLVPTPQPVLDAFEGAVEALTAAGATVIDLDAAGFTFPPATGELLVLDYDFRNDVKAYFATRVGVPVAGGTLQSAIDFNNAHADVEMPFFNQDLFEQAQSLAAGPNDPQPVFSGMTYNQALEIDRLAGVNGIDAALSQFHLDAVVSATDNPAWATDLVFGDHFIFGTSGLAAPAGYQIVQVPAGMGGGRGLAISYFW